MKRQIAFLGLLFLATAAAAPAAGRPVQIIVTGSGSVAVMPDQANVSASVVTNAPAATDAVSQNNVAYERVVAALGRAGIRKSDISLSYYNVDYVAKPTEPNPPPSYQRYGYTVTRSFSIKVHAAGKAGAVIDAATAAGATTIGGVSFGLSDPAKAKSQATAKAVADARSKAAAVAAASGLHVTGIARIELDGVGGGVSPMLRVSAMAAPKATEIEPSDVNVSSNVTIVYTAAP